MADDAPSELLSRRHQMFPVLATPTSRASVASAAPQALSSAATRVFAAGGPSPGMFVVLEGRVAISQRDGLGHVVPIVRQGPGQFTAEVGTLSGRPSLVDVHAVEDMRTLLVRARPAARTDHRRSRPGRTAGACADPAPRRR